MANSITKILFRQGLNVIRNLQSVIFDVGEPAWTTDTKRLFVGDGVTIGGIPVGVKNWGTVTKLLSTNPTGYVTAAYSIPLSAVEIGDIVYDSTAVTLYYSNSSNPPASAWSGYTFFNLSVSGGNGISVTTQNGVVSAVLGPEFTVNDSTQRITVNYDMFTNTGRGISANANVVAGGLVGAQGGNSQQWNSNFSTTQTNSATWETISSIVSSTSANWNSVYSTTVANSGTWNGPQFIQPVLLAYGTTLTGWTTQSLSPYVSFNIHTAILQVNIYAQSTTTPINIIVATRPSSSYSYFYQAGEYGDGIGNGGINNNTFNQSFIPIDYSTNTFQWTLSNLANAPNIYGCWIYLIGYIK
jgi:hypothetical protein